MYRWSLPALLLLFPALTSAQDVLHIADPAAILPSVDLGKEAGAKTCLKEAGLDDAVADEVLLLGSSTNWPAGLRTSSATPATPRPASPARAASMAALSASRLV